MNFDLSSYYGSTPESYETMVADICKLMATGHGADVQTRRKFVGQSGQTHEIDVAVDVIIGKLRYLTLVECKCWKKKVGVEEVMVLQQRVQDLGAHKGVMVTTAGFQKGAMTFAEANGIALVLCRDRSEVVVRRESRIHNTIFTKSKWHEAPRIFSSRYAYGQMSVEKGVLPVELPFLCNPLLLAFYMDKFSKSSAKE